MALTFTEPTKLHCQKCQEFVQAQFKCMWCGKTEITNEWRAPDRWLYTISEVTGNQLCFCFECRERLADLTGTGIKIVKNEILP